MRTEQNTAWPPGGTDRPTASIAGESSVWFAFLGGAVAWALRLGLAYPLVPLACHRDAMWPLYALSAVMAVLAGAAAWVGWRRRDGGAASRTVRRRRFLARAGMLLSLFFLAAIGVESATLATDDPCMVPGGAPPATLAGRG